MSVHYIGFMVIRIHQLLRKMLNSPTVYILLGSDTNELSVRFVVYHIPSTLAEHCVDIQALSNDISMMHFFCLQYLY